MAERNCTKIWYKVPHPTLSGRPSLYTLDFHGNRPIITVTFKYQKNIFGFSRDFICQFSYADEKIIIILFFIYCLLLLLLYRQRNCSSSNQVIVYRKCICNYTILLVIEEFVCSCTYQNIWRTNTTGNWNKNDSSECECARRIFKKKIKRNILVNCRLIARNDRVVFRKRRVYRYNIGGLDRATHKFPNAIAKN